MESRYHAKITNYQVLDNDKVVYFIVVQDTTKGGIHTSKFRYSELKSFHEKLKKQVSEYKLVVDMPHYPGTKLFGTTNKSQEAIQERKSNMEQYVNEILYIKKLWSLSIVKTLLGPPNLEEDRFLDEFLRDEEKEQKEWNPPQPNNSQVFGDYYRVNIESFCREEDTIKYFFKFYDMHKHTTWETKYRYSELKGLHEAIKSEMKKKVELPKFPGNKIFGITNEDKQEIFNRRDLLQEYVNGILAEKSVLELPITKYFIEDSKLHSEGNEIELKELQFKFIMKKLRMRRDQAMQLIIQSGRRGFNQIREFINDYIQQNALSQENSKAPSVKSSTATLQPILEEINPEQNNSENNSKQKTQQQIN